MGFFNFFKKKPQQSQADKLQDVAQALIVSRFRSFGAQFKCAPTEKTSDQKVYDIYLQVSKAFKQASSDKNEHLPAGNLNTIVLKFCQVHEMMGETMFNDHLKHEVDKYMKSGLRQDYKKQLDLF